MSNAQVGAKGIVEEGILLRDSPVSHSLQFFTNYYIARRWTEGLNANLFLQSSPDFVRNFMPGPKLCAKN